MSLILVFRQACPSQICQSQHLLSHLIFIIFHQYSPWFPSEYHLRIIFDHSHCQNIHSQSQNCCSKNFLIFGEKLVPQSAQMCATGGVKYTRWGSPKLYLPFISDLHLFKWSYNIEMRWHKLFKYFCIKILVKKRKWRWKEEGWSFLCGLFVPSLHYIHIIPLVAAHIMSCKTLTQWPMYFQI